MVDIVVRHDGVALMFSTANVEKSMLYRPPMEKKTELPSIEELMVRARQKRATNNPLERAVWALLEHRNRRPGNDEAWRLLGAALSYLIELEPTVPRAVEGGMLLLRPPGKPPDAAAIGRAWDAVVGGAEGQDVRNLVGIVNEMVADAMYDAIRGMDSYGAKARALARLTHNPTQILPELERRLRSCKKAKGPGRLKGGLQTPEMIVAFLLGDGDARRVRKHLKRRK
jgi:hypothetical protein